MSTDVENVGYAEDKGAFARVKSALDSARGFSANLASATGDTGVVRARASAVRASRMRLRVAADIVRARVVGWLSARSKVRGGERAQSLVVYKGQSPLASTGRFRFQSESTRVSN